MDRRTDRPSFRDVRTHLKNMLSASAVERDLEVDATLTGDSGETGWLGLGGVLVDN